MGAKSFTTGKRDASMSISVPPLSILKGSVVLSSNSRISSSEPTFAWIAAADTDEVRDERLKQFEREEFTLRKRAERQLVDQIGGQKKYAHLFTSGRFPTSLLDEATRARADVLEGDKSIKPLPDVLQMAYVADDRWMPEIDLVHSNPFASFYFLVFTSSSFTTHASVTSVARAITGTPPNLIVGLPALLGEGAGPYGMTVALIGSVLLVAGRVFGGRPSEEEVFAALNTQ
jgi:hypothetical protein